MKEIQAELAGLERETERIARMVLDEIYPSIKERVRTGMLGVVDLLDHAWESLQRYERETPVELTGRHWEGLRFPPILDTEKLRNRLERWL